MSENKELVLPSGDRVDFIDETHAYWLTQAYDGKKKRLPSVTTILDILNKPALMGWVAKVTSEGNNWREERDKAASTGSLVHAAIENHLGHGLKIDLEDYEDNEKAQNCLRSYVQWETDRKPELLAAEFILVDLVAGFAGMPDLLCKVNDEVWLVDFKTSGGIYPEYHLQLAAYAGCLAQCGYAEADNLCVVRLAEEGYHEEFSLAHYQDFEDVLAARQAYKGLEKRINQARRQMERQAA